MNQKNSAFFILLLFSLTSCSNSHSMNQNFNELSVDSTSTTISGPTEEIITSDVKERESMEIAMQIADMKYSVTLNSSNAAKDFYKMLPLTLTLKDYHATEKIADLPEILDISDSPSGTEAKKGDLSYFAPWGNLAIFYKDFRYGEGLVNLGKINLGDSELKNSSEPLEVRFERESFFDEKTSR